MAKIVIDLKGLEDNLKAYEKDRVLYDRDHRDIINNVLDAAIAAGVIEKYVVTPNDRLFKESKQLAEAERNRKGKVIAEGRCVSYADIQEGIKQYPSLISELNELIVDTGIQVVETSFWVNFYKKGKSIHIDELEPEVAETILSAIEKLDLAKEVAT